MLAEEGLACDVASGGELALALRGGFDPARIYLHGNAKSVAELEFALEAGVGHIVLDSLHDVERLERVAAERGATQDVLIRVTPDVSGDTHAAISTGQADSKFGFGLEDAPRAIDHVAGSPHLRLVGLHCHIGSQLLELEPFMRAIAALATLGDFDVYNLGGGLGVAYLETQEPPSIADYVATLVNVAHATFGPGQAPADRARSLAGRQLHGHAVYGPDREAQRLDLGRGRRRHVRQPAADALRVQVRGSDRRTACSPPPPKSASSPASTASRAT